MKLKYLFEVEFTDGTTYKQNSSDTSLFFPPSQERNTSSFTDVVARLHEVKRFTLVEQVLLGNKYTVDLTNGHFEVNGVSFYPNIPLIPSSFTLIFYRTHQQDMQVTYSKETGKEIAHAMGEHRISYIIGWQAKVAGKNIEQTIVIK